jgi:hypothetical protein
MGKAKTLIKAIEEDFQERHPQYHKSRREGLATLAGVMLDVRSANLMELSAALPREIGTTHDRYQYMERQLKNDKTDVDATIKPYALEVIERLSARGETIILQMDQSHINDVNEVLMLSVRMRKRALPVAWRVRSTQGNIGIGVQKELLDGVKAWIPESASIVLAADRFYGTAQLYRLVPKGRMVIPHSHERQSDPQPRGW